MAHSVERKLTTILCADVFGYSRLMEQDEAGTLAALSACREAIDGLVRRHRGRVVSTAGDGLLADFPSVVEAVQCAIEIQQELSGRNRSLPGPRRMLFRIGINLGDVMLHGGDLFGEGVNVAARLEALAEPGGICISRPVYDLVRNKLSVGFEDLGDQAVKNISEPVQAFRVRLDGAADDSRRGRPARPPRPDRADTGSGLEDPQAAAAGDLGGLPDRAPGRDQPRHVAWISVVPLGGFVLRRPSRLGRAQDVLPRLGPALTTAIDKEQVSLAMAYLLDGKFNHRY